MYLFRINLSHTELDAVEGTIAKIREYSSTPICIDTEGAQVRCGRMGRDVVLRAGTRLRLRIDPAVGTQEAISLTPGFVVSGLTPGALVTIDFNAAMLQVIEVCDGFAEALVLNGGHVGSNKAVTVLPSPSLPPLSEKDLAALDIAKRRDIRHAALSYANSGDDVDRLRRAVGSDFHIISKIESRQGVLHLDEIVARSDAVLIDRGDLSREVPLENVPLLQKAIIRKANAMSTPVYVATNLLESMVTNQSPTRAEINDVMNTLMDGANGLVLAAETAIGAYPVAALDMVLSVANKYSQSLDGFRLEDLVTDDSPVGVATPTHDLPDRDVIDSLPAIVVDSHVAADVEQILSGAFAPVQGFMTATELESVLAHHELPTGHPWPVPIVLQLAEGEQTEIRPGRSIVLRDASGTRALALLHVLTKDKIDPATVAERWFGTSDNQHPGVHRLLSRSDTIVGGRIQPVDVLGTQPSPALSPETARRILRLKGWRRVVGFDAASLGPQVSNDVLRAAIKLAGADGVLIRALLPASGATLSVRQAVEPYQRLIADGLDGIVCPSLPVDRHGGVRGVMLAAIWARNLGCTHYAVSESHLESELHCDLATLSETLDTVGDLEIVLVPLPKSAGAPTAA